MPEPNEKLRIARRQRNWSQGKAAQKIDIDRKTYMRWENGQHQPQPGTLERVCEVFGMTSEELGFTSIPLSQMDTVEESIGQKSSSDPSSHSPSPKLPSSPSSYYRQIIDFPPPTEPGAIQQRTNIVNDIYSLLAQGNISAIVLTGIGGCGKSTLAALTYQYAEEQRRNGQGPFIGEALWLKIDESTTLIDLVGTLFEALEKPLPSLSSFTPSRLAIPLFKALNTAEKPRLIVLDQFENFLDALTGQALVTNPGIGELLDVLNSQICRCRLLFTSRARPRGARDYQQIYLKEYYSGKLSLIEGVELLQKHGVEGTETDLQRAVKRCDGHAYALVLLASLLGTYKERLSQILENSELWRGDIATRLLDYIYKQQLNKEHHDLLHAFSVYREAVPIEAVQVFFPEMPKPILQSVQRVLLTQYLLQASGEGYRLHAIIAQYTRDHFDEADERVNREKLRTAHAKAADYYLQQATIKCPPRGQRQGIADVHWLIEATWQQCQAGLWQQSYDLLEREELFADLHYQGGNTTLLELYQLLLPLETWSKEDSLVTRRIYFCLGAICMTLGQFKRAREYYVRLKDICNKIGDHSSESQTLLKLGEANASSGQREVAKGYYEQARQLCKEIGDRIGEGQALREVGWAHSALWNREVAKECYEQALQIAIQVEDRSGEAWTHMRLATIYDMSDEKERAKEHHLQALRLMKSAGEVEGEGWAFEQVGKTYHDLGQSEQALDFLNQGINLFKTLDNYRGEAWGLNNIGKIYLDLNRKEQAQQCLSQALSIFMQVEDLWGQGAVLNKLGRLYHSMGRTKDAQMYYKRALSKRREVQDLWGEGQTLFEIGKLFREQQCQNVALASLLLARECFEKTKSPEIDCTQKEIDELRKEIGERQFALLTADVEQQKRQSVEQAQSLTLYISNSLTNGQS